MSLKEAITETAPFRIYWIAEEKEPGHRSGIQRINLKVQNMNLTSKLLVLAIAIVAVFGFYELSTHQVPSSGSAVVVQPCSKQVVALPGEKKTEGFNIQGTLIDNSDRVAIGAESSAFLLIGADGVAYELNFCGDAVAVQRARSLAGTPVWVNGALLEKEKVESHARKIIHADGVSPMLAQPQVKD